MVDTGYGYTWLRVTPVISHARTHESNTRLRVTSCNRNQMAIDSDGLASERIAQRRSERARGGMSMKALGRGVCNPCGHRRQDPWGSINFTETNFGNGVGVNAVQKMVDYPIQRCILSIEITASAGFHLNALLRWATGSPSAFEPTDFDCDGACA